MQINCFDFQIECLEHRRTCLFIVHLGVTVRSKRLTVTMERSILDHFDYIKSVGSLMEGPDDPFDMHFKTPLNCAPWIAIGWSRCAPRHLIRTVILLLIKHVLLIAIGGPRVRVIDVPRSCFILIQHSTIGHVTCIFKNRVELSPTREKLKEFEGFIRSGVFRALIIPSDKRKAILIYKLYINKYKYSAAWARVTLPCGLACHVASTWVPRGNTPLFAFI